LIVKILIQAALSDVSGIIESRNKERVAAWEGRLEPELANNWAYEYLLPKNIPQSINI
jgi:hypothetical protein